jgi:hypothetical protein
MAAAVTFHFDPNPATAALEAAQRQFSLKSSCADDDVLSSQFVTMTLQTEAFPVIRWDGSDEDASSLSDSCSSERSMDDWSSFLNDFDCCVENAAAASCGGNSKRSYTSSEERRLVRSKKIKSNLSTLARSLSCPSA